MLLKPEDIDRIADETFLKPNGLHEFARAIEREVVRILGEDHMHEMLRRVMEMKAELEALKSRRGPSYHPLLAESLQQRILAGKCNFQRTDRGYLVPYDKILITGDRVAFYQGEDEQFYFEHTVRFDQGETVTIDGITGGHPLKTD